MIILESSVIPKCSYHVIMFGGPLRDAPSIGVLCSVYNTRCLSELGPWKKQVSLRHKRTKATQQDLSTHILLYKTNCIDHVPHNLAQQWLSYNPCLPNYYTYDWRSGGILAEWLRRKIRNLLGSARAGSNPADVAPSKVVFLFSFFQDTGSCLRKVMMIRQKSL